jgi:hypothetical protein
MRDWLIRILHGVPLPKDYSKLHLVDGAGFIIISGYSDDIIKFMGAVPLPVAGPGENVVGPVVRKNPTRTKKGLEELGKRTGQIING